MILILVAIIFGIIGGLWLAKEAKSELKAGRTWFRSIIIISLIAVLVSTIFLRDAEGYEALLAACLFLATLASVSYRKSHN